VYCPIRGNNNEENIKPPNHRLDVYATGMVRDFSMSTTGGRWTVNESQDRDCRAYTKQEWIEFTAWNMVASFEMEMVP
jgi:hypothetical protein